MVKRNAQLVTERDAMIAQWTESDAIIAQLRKQLAERNTAMERHIQLLTERDTTIARSRNQSTERSTRMEANEDRVDEQAQPADPIFEQHKGLFEEDERDQLLS